MGRLAKFCRNGAQSGSHKRDSVSTFEMVSAGRRMLLPIDSAKIADFNDSHQTPQDVISPTSNALQAQPYSRQ